MTQAVNKIGKYEVVEVLGRGGMGVVYKAMDPRIGRLVAIKMMTGGFAENPDLLKRFYREAQSTGTLQHPNIVIVYDLGDQEGNPYLVMEFLEGESLEKLITSRRPMPIVRKLEVIVQVCQALNYAHARGIVHRDIKPANVMVLRDGSVKLVDFGIARIGGDSMTRTGQVVGTISYMSPEQINAQVVDGRTDIFSAGVMLYQLLTHTLPFEGNDTASTLLKIIHEPPPPLAKLLPDCPPELEEAVGRALAKDREERYATAEDFAFDLSRVREALRRTMVNEYLEQAQTLLGKSELAKAKELLVEVLKVDTQHSSAKQLLNQVQQMMQKQQRGEQVRQLRALADDAIAHNLHSEALSYLDQAISLDATSVDLGNLRQQVQQALEKQKKLDEALRRAEAAQQVDDLEKAAAAASEALTIDPHSTRAVALHGAILKELEARRRERELHSLIDEAKRDISSRKFTAAFEVLKKAEELDPSAPEVHALLNLASSGREQEQKRRDLEKFSNDIQDALNRDHDEAAMRLCDEALQKFPSEPNLLKLKKLAEKRQEANQRRKLIDEQMAAARKLLESGQAADALRTLEEAARKFGGETRIQSLLAIVRESAEREKLEKRKAEFVQQAKAALRNKDYKGAVAILEKAAEEVEESAEIQDLLQFARDEMAQTERRAKIEAAAEEAQKLIAAEEYDRAEALLTATMQSTPDEELKFVLAEVRRAKEGLKKSIESAMNRARRLLEMRKPDEAVALLEAQPKGFAQSAEFCRVVEQARDELDRFKKVQAAVEAAEAAAARDDYSGAHKALDAARETIGDTAELAEIGTQLSARRVERVKSVVERAVRDGRMLLLARQYDAALRTLEDVATVAKHAPDDLKKQFEALKKDATAGAARSTPTAPAPGATIVAGSSAPAHTVIAGSTESAAVISAPSAPAPVAGAAASAPAPAPAKPAPPPVLAKKAPVPSQRVEPGPAGKKSMLIPALIAVVMVIAAVGGYLAMKSGPAAPVADSYIAINAVPWATVKTVEPADGGAAVIREQQTPLRVAVAAGAYKVTLVGPNATERIETVVVSADKSANVNVVFEEIDVDSILATH